MSIEGDRVDMTGIQAVSEEEKCLPVEPYNDNDSGYNAPRRVGGGRRTRIVGTLLKWLVLLLVIIALGFSVKTYDSLRSLVRLDQHTAALLAKVNEHTTPPPPGELSEEEQFQLDRSAERAANEAILGHVYVINLERRYDRRDRMASILNHINVPHEFLPGVTADKIEFNAPEINGHPISKNLMACWRSHMNVYRDALEKGYPHITIVEDDTDMEVDLTTRVSRALEVLDPEWDMFYLGHCSVGYHKGPKVINDPNIIRLNGPWCTHGYMVSRRAYAKLLKVLEVPSGAIDSMISEATHAGKFKVYAPEPLWVAQIRNDDPSDIPESGVGYQWNDLRNSTRQSLDALFNFDSAVSI
ncbi:hypothetical protein IWQ60_011650 [Tieghemiomyces parasiticus]|uniref:Glycosyl transferase family 25 domain-containing protein n=1 Tax=Tieghemiomyces parasiticus TaxID=78921 RepID=A0A9W8DM22_9FUNG|nr:hypothetical protein IWQ60_011650 [Tieghemiomyces parasiticus]